MQNLRRIIQTNLLKFSACMMVIILAGAGFLQVLLVQNQARNNARDTFAQVELVLNENVRELAQVEEEYRQTCLLNADTIAYMIQYHPEILGDVQEFRNIARMMEVDEIHIFEDGEIFTGTHPEYYKYNFDTGEQIGFFRPMMEDKTLRLCQDITPNTAEGKLVQYSAVWSKDGKYIVQVGMYPETVLAVTERNELSYVFSLLQGNPGVDLYAINKDTGEIVGSTTGGDHGRDLTHVGFSMEDIDRYLHGAHVTVSGVDSYAVFSQHGEIYIGYVISNDLLYNNIPAYVLLEAACLALIEVAVLISMSRFTDKHIVSVIRSTNEKLRTIAAGNLDERVDIRSSVEFAELGSHINSLIRSLLSSTDKMSLILNRTNMLIGAYEYNMQMKTVRFTDHLPQVLDLDRAEMEHLASDYRLLQAFIDRLRREPVPDEKNVFHFTGKREMYVKLDEVANGDDRLGIVMDVTEETITRRTVEAERDLDSLTGLYNRRGMDAQLEKIFSGNDDLGYGALIMMDSDGLKNVNDMFGHATGDLYLKCIADKLRSFGSAKHISARQSGDEFIMLLYGYQSENGVMDDLKKLREVQKEMLLATPDGGSVQVRFSFGYVLTHSRRDYNTMLSEADGYMYAVKRQRKNALARMRAEEELSKKMQG